MSQIVTRGYAEVHLIVTRGYGGTEPIVWVAEPAFIVRRRTLVTRVHRKGIPSLIAHWPLETQTVTRRFANQSLFARRQKVTVSREARKIIWLETHRKQIANVVHRANIENIIRDVKPVQLIKRKQIDNRIVRNVRKVKTITRGEL